MADQSVLYIYADGPKDASDKQTLQKITDTRAIAKSRNWCKEVHIIEREKNAGLASSIISGVTEVIKKYGRIIVLEDDIIVSPFFLQYMNDGLAVYKDDKRVISIHGFNYPIATEGLPETFFMKGADCWGWATWLRGWNLFEEDATKLLSDIEAKQLQYEFDLEGSYPYTKMLKDQVERKIDSWAIRWYASAFLNNKFTLYPKQSIVHNVGLDGSGTHGDINLFFTDKQWNTTEAVEIIYQGDVQNNIVALSKWKTYLLKCGEAKVSGKSKNSKEVLKKAILGIFRFFHRLKLK